MTDKEYYKSLWQNCRKRIYRFLSVLAVMCLALSMCSCKSTSSLTEREVRDSIRYIDNIRDSVNIINQHNIKDSIRIKDSIVTVMDSAGNVLHTKEYHSEKEYHFETDSTAFYKAVAQQAILEMIKAQNERKEVVVEKKLNRWEQLKVDWGGYALLVLFLLLIYMIQGVIRKRAAG